MNGGPPYLSVVVVARNDDHGGGLLGRMQAFVNACIAQCERHRLPAELIIVEWNPPPDRPRLAEALRWPEVRNYCEVRILEVSPAIHARYRHGAALPLYQMIGKNVGIRRARGRFVLATNIDILFSDELMEFLARQELDAARMYRIDRHDVLGGVPEDGIDGQLAYCQANLIRVNARDGTFRLTRDGHRTASDHDITAPESGISLGEGWHPVEEALGVERFRWAGNPATIHLARGGLLALELEPGPSMEEGPLILQILDADGLELGQVAIRGRSKLSIPAAAEERFQTLTLRTVNASAELANDPRALNFRAFSCGWESERGRKQLKTGVRAESEGLSAGKRLYRRWSRFQRFLAMLAYSEAAHISVRAPWPLKRLLQFYCGHGGIVGMLTGKKKHPPIGPRTATGERDAPLSLHTNACGDFTLIAREGWFDLRGYPEFDLYSMHLDSVFCYAAHHSGFRELILREPMRIFHIEHGSGWTPEGEVKLFTRLTERGVPFLSYGDLLGWAVQMRRLRSPMIFNAGDWGLGDFELPEKRPCSAVETGR